MLEMTPPNHNPPLILIADDDKTVRVSLRRAMEQEGFQVVEAANGEDCLIAFTRLRPDLVLLDAIMPIVDGFTCCTRIHQMRGSERIPILMITGLEDQESVDLAFSAGAVDYVTKPIHWAVLRQRVRRLIQQVRLYGQLEEANHELQRLATFDGLTQVANRRHFDQYLHQEWQRTLNKQLPLSLILCDIDCFKAYNDTYGHQAGDECLRQVAQVIQKSAQRAFDLSARYGGEEFAVILPDTHLEGAAYVAQTIQRGVCELAIAHASSQVNSVITVSLGVTTIIPHSETAPDLLVMAADKALYQAKAEGRNRYHTCAII